MTSRKKYRITLIEPSDIVCGGIKAFLACEDEFEITHTLSDMRQWDSHPKARTADIVMINPLTVDTYGRGHIRSLLALGSDPLLAALLYGYASPNELTQYDCVIGIGDAKEDAIGKLHRALENKIGGEPPRESADLSEREKEILTGIVEGHTNKEIAAIHHLSVHTVISHRKNISRKTGIKSVSGLTVYALLNNMVKASDVE